MITNREGTSLSHGVLPGLQERAAEKQAAVAKLIRERSMDIQRTFGLSKEDTDFDECVRLGREFRDAQSAS